MSTIIYICHLMDESRLKKKRQLEKKKKHIHLESHLGFRDDAAKMWRSYYHLNYVFF